MASWSQHVLPVWTAGGLNQTVAPLLPPWRHLTVTQNSVADVLQEIQFLQTSTTNGHQTVSKHAQVSWNPGWGRSRGRKQVAVTSFCLKPYQNKTLDLSGAFYFRHPSLPCSLEETDDVLTGAKLSLSSSKRILKSASPACQIISGFCSFKK